MYSDISTRMSASSVSNRKRARERASSVFPTPVGPGGGGHSCGAWTVGADVHAVIAPLNTSTQVSLFAFRILQLLPFGTAYLNDACLAVCRVLPVTLGRLVGLGVDIVQYRRVPRLDVGYLRVLAPALDLGTSGKAEKQYGDHSANGIPR